MSGIHYSPFFIYQIVCIIAFISNRTMGCAICKFGEQTVLFKDTLESAEWILNGIHYDYVRCDHC